MVWVKLLHLLLFLVIKKIYQISTTLPNRLIQNFFTFCLAKIVACRALFQTEKWTELGCKSCELFCSSLSKEISSRFVQKGYVKKLTCIFKSDCNVKLRFKVNLIFVGNHCNKCPSGWSSHIIGTTRRCLFTSKSKVEISQLDTFCQSLNATVLYPKTSEENQNYLAALETRNLTTPVAIKSCHGTVELHRNGYWNPFPTETSLYAVCEKAEIVQTGRVKRQASSGNKLLIFDRFGCL